MKKSIIFDLDMTLVDSSAADAARKARDWRLVYSLIPQFRLYTGLRQVFDYIEANEIYVSIVSTSPSVYVKKVCEHFAIPYNHIVGYHDAKPIKPHPAPMWKALELLGVRPENSISYGDRSIDIFSSRSAGIKSVGCYWGTKDCSDLDRSLPDIKLYKPSEIINTLI